MNHSILSVFLGRVRRGSWDRWSASILALALTAALAGLARAQEGPGFALGFDGVDDEVSVAHNSALNAFPLTVMTWLRTTQTNGAPGLVNKLRFNSGTGFNGWQVSLVNGNVRARYLAGLEDYVWDGTAGLNGGAVADGAWHHVAFVVDAVGGRIYVDGVLKEALPWEGAPGPSVSTGPMLLGNRSDPATGRFFNGTLDEVSVWNAAQAETEIQANMRRILTGSEPGLVAYYRFNEGSGGTTADRAPAGGNNQGTLNNGPVWVSPVTTLLVTTARASAIGARSATLNGAASLIATDVSAWFEWGATTNYGNVTPPRPLVSGVNTNFSEILTNLNLHATYQFRAIASNSVGVMAGANQTFITPLFSDIGAGLPGASIGSAALGDYDNDGRLDILLTGHSAGLISQVWRNTGSGFTNINAGLPGVNYSSAAWGDYDNDGRLDILLTGSASVNSTGDPAAPISQIWRNTGNGFININAGLPGVFSGSVAWGDYDNDGRLDILLAGFTGSQHISEVWRNTGSCFVNINAGLPGISSGCAAWGDYDNDGRLDILLTGASRSEIISQVWRNTGHGFTNINAGLVGVYNSSAAWGDYDNDGWLDILLTGFTGSGGVAQVWRNTGGSFTNINAGLPGVNYSSVAWGDCDNDGRLDILLTGLFGLERISQIWRNTGGGFTNINADLPGAYAGSVAWGDYDNDGRLDLLLTGETSIGRISLVWRNNTLLGNTAPAAPGGLRAILAGSAVTFRWDAASDPQTATSGLSYNLRVGTTPTGGDLAGPMSANDGRRGVSRLGSAQHNRSLSLTGLPLGRPIFWSVQSVDTAFAGSAFAPEQSLTFNIVLTPPSGIPVPGDINGDGAVSEAELNTVLSNYFPNSPFLQLTNVAGLGGTNVTFALTNSFAGTFGVEYATNLQDWHFLGHATPRYQFTDTNAPALPRRFYRLRWP